MLERGPVRLALALGGSAALHGGLVAGWVYLREPPSPAPADGPGVEVRAIAVELVAPAAAPSARSDSVSGAAEVDKPPLPAAKPPVPSSEMARLPPRPNRKPRLSRPRPRERAALEHDPTRLSYPPHPLPWSPRPSGRWATEQASAEPTRSARQAAKARPAASPSLRNPLPPIGGRGKGEGGADPTQTKVILSAPPGLAAPAPPAAPPGSGDAGETARRPDVMGGEAERTAPGFSIGSRANPPPVYPLSARRRGQEGRVVLRVRVGRGGRVREITVIETSGHPVLDDAAREAVSGWRFEPARIGGAPAEGAVDVPIVFRLSS